MNQIHTPQPTAAAPAAAALPAAPLAIFIHGLTAGSITLKITRSGPAAAAPSVTAATASASATIRRITLAEAEEMRALYMEGDTSPDGLAARFGISPRRVSRILRNETYRPHDDRETYAITANLPAGTPAPADAEAA